VMVVIVRKMQKKKKRIIWDTHKDRQKATLDIVLTRAITHCAALAVVCGVVANKNENERLTMTRDQIAQSSHQPIETLICHPVP